MANDKKELLRKRVESEADFINAPRLSNSLSNLMRNGKKTLSDETICKFLCISESELHISYKNAIEKVRSLLKLEQN